MSSVHIGPAAWVAIEPVLSESVKVLTNRRKALQDGEKRTADLVKRVDEILKGTVPGERTPPAKAAEGPVEVIVRPDGSYEIVFEDVDWRSRIGELVGCLRRHGLSSVAAEIERRLPPKLTTEDRVSEKYSQGELAFYRKRKADETAAVEWLLAYLQAIQSEQTSPADPLPQGTAGGGDQAARRLLRVFTKGLSDERFRKAAELLQDSGLTADDKLTKIDAVIPFPATVSAEELGRLVGVSKQAVLKTSWWIQNRKGKGDDRIAQRRDRHRERAGQCERDQVGDGD